MTNQQAAPEALPDPSPDKLRAIARTARNSSGGASDDCGPLAYVLHGWRAAAIAFRAQQAALVEAQQPAAHVQNPAEIEHVAGDVSKNGPELNMAQQPAPSAAAATEVENLRKALQFYADKDHFNIADDGAWDTVSGEPQNYWCDEEGTATVEDGTIARLALAGHQIKFEADASPQPSPTPQADSQPAAVRDYPPLPEQVAWRDSFEHCDLYWRPVVQEHNDLEPLFTDTQMRAYVDADRAARAPADSVLKDAADPLQGAANWLAEAHGQFSPIMLAGCLMIGYNRAKRLHDAALAARKQGANHD